MKGDTRIRIRTVKPVPSQNWTAGLKIDTTPDELAKLGVPADAYKIVGTIGKEPGAKPEPLPTDAPPPPATASSDAPKGKAGK